jgi:hypothetical protein
MKSHVVAALAALLLIGLTGCDTDALPPAAGATMMQGTVLDHDNKPVAGAVVTIDTVLTATTDATGAFKFEKVPSGIVDFTVQAQGFALYTSTANAEPGKPAVVNVTLDPQPAGGTTAPI